MFFEFIVVLLSLTNAIVAPFTYWPIRDGYDFYIPIIIFVGTYILSLLLLILYLQIAGMIVLRIRKIHPTGKYSEAFARFNLAEAIAIICFHVRIKTRTKGNAKLPKKERFLFVCNHRSNFDPMITIDELRHYKIDFVTKTSNMKIPLAKNFLKSLNFLAIDREDRMQSLQTMNKAIKLIQDGVCSIGIYPEGTRSHQSEMLPFHEGVFSIALKAKCPLVIATVRNTEQIHKRFPRVTRVNHDIVNVIPYEELEGKTPKAIADMVKEIMQNNLSRYELHE